MREESTALGAILKRDYATRSLAQNVRQPPIHPLSLPSPMLSFSYVQKPSQGLLLLNIVMYVAQNRNLLCRDCVLDVANHIYSFLRTLLQV